MITEYSILDLKSHYQGLGYATETIKKRPENLTHFYWPRYFKK